MVPCRSSATIFELRRGVQLFPGERANLYTNFAILRLNHGMTPVKTRTAIVANANAKKVENAGDSPDRQW